MTFLFGGWSWVLVTSRCYCDRRSVCPHQCLPLTFVTKKRPFDLFCMSITLHPQCVKFSPKDVAVWFHFGVQFFERGKCVSRSSEILKWEIFLVCIFLLVCKFLWEILLFYHFVRLSFFLETSPRPSISLVGFLDIYKNSHLLSVTSVLYSRLKMFSL